MNEMALKESSAAFLDYLDTWLARLPSTNLPTVITHPAHTALLCVDVTNGFCTNGPLSSPRVQGIVLPITRLFEQAHALGVRHFLLPQDTHDPQAVEFSQYPPHCVRGDVQSQTVPELMGLPFASEYVVMEKNSISSSENTALNAWLDAHPQVNTFIVTGDCTDLCTYQLAMHLRLRAYARQMPDVRVIVPANCVQTYDTPMEAAARLGILPHPGDLLHATFLYNMSANGVEVYSHLA
jgi:nicotinamidase-related amidase